MRGRIPHRSARVLIYRMFTINEHMFGPASENRSRFPSSYRRGGEEGRFRVLPELRNVRREQRFRQQGKILHYEMLGHVPRQVGVLAIGMVIGHVQDTRLVANEHKLADLRRQNLDGFFDPLRISLVLNLRFVTAGRRC